MKLFVHWWLVFGVVWGNIFSNITIGNIPDVINFKAIALAWAPVDFIFQGSPSFEVTYVTTSFSHYGSHFWHQLIVIIS